MLIPFEGCSPVISKNAFIEQSARIIGDVWIGDSSSVWFNTVVRGDVHRIRIGRRTNIQDNSTVHVTTGRHATQIGDEVTAGHGVILHGCTVGDRCLIGMGAILLDGVVIEPNCLIGAGSILPPGMTVPTGSVVLGSPARVVRSLREEEYGQIVASAEAYVLHATRYRSQATP